MASLVDIALPAFATFFIIIDPIGLLPIFLGLTQGWTAAQKRATARRGILVAGIVLTLFAFFGGPLLQLLGIDLPAFKVAGGVMLFMIALEMVFERRTERREQAAEQIHAEEQVRHPAPDDISIFPVAMPLLAGPGAIASLLLFMSRTEGDILGQAIVLGIVWFVLGITLVLFLMVEPIEKLIGRTITKIMSRVFGIILAALAAQFVLDGVRALWLAPL